MSLNVWPFRNLECGLYAYITTPLQAWAVAMVRTKGSHYRHCDIINLYGDPVWVGLATVLLQLHCLLFGVLGWVSVQHFEISTDVRRAI